MPRIILHLNETPLIVNGCGLGRRLHMSDDINEKLRDKNKQIMLLNQKMESLQAQLSGSQKRANQLSTQVSELEARIAEREQEMRILQDQLARTKGAFESVAKEMQGIKAEQTQLLTKKKPQTDNASLKDDLALADTTIFKLKEDLKQFSHVASAVVNQEEGSLEHLKRTLFEIGDPKYRILNMVLNRKSIRAEEIASNLMMDVTETLKYIDLLQAAGEIEVRNGNIIIPAQKYLEMKVPREEWMAMDSLDILDQLEAFVGKTDDTSSIVNAIDAVVEILEQKLARGGALFFQMRRTSESWKRRAGNLEELRYIIKEWKSRAQVLS